MEDSTYKDMESLIEPERLFDMSGRVVVILGGAGKMGQQFAVALGNSGATAIIADLDKNRCETLANQLSGKSKVPIVGFGCDVNKECDIVELFQGVNSEYGRLDGLVFNVMAKPSGYYRPFEEYPLDTWNSVINANLDGAFLGCRESLKYMNSGAAIVLTSSTYGVVGADQRIYENCSPASNIYGGSDPLSCPASYAASKAALIGLGKHLAVSYGKKGIRVNTLTPGGVFDGQEETFHVEYIRRTPLGRMAVWSDYNGAILFMLSDASRYMTGSNIVVDGGWTAW
jgi:NAD(P)-dependent dehydrogenase (short-subunit alcohol dehydrogenase family)